MKTILVSGSSGIVGCGILRSLRKSKEKLKLIGTSIYDDSAAEGFCDLFIKALPTEDPNYIEWFLNTIEKYKIDLVFPGIEIDVYTWLLKLNQLNYVKKKLLLNDYLLISLCKDKWIFYENMKKYNLPYVIESSLSQDFDFLVKSFGLPFILKPRCGYASRGFVKVDNAKIFSEHKNLIGETLLAQPLIGNSDEEYTTSLFGDGKGKFFCHMSLKRKLSKEGFTSKAEVVEIDEMNKILSDLCQHFKPEGPTNFQFRKHNGELKLLEINPRISSSTSIRTAFGYNECEMSVDYYLNNIMPKQPIIKSGVAVRYIEDLIIK